MACVPWAKVGISNTPSGPFQRTVLTSASASLMSSRVFSPTSTMCQDAGIFSVPRVLYSVPAGDLLGDDDVDRQDDLDALLLGRREDPPRVLDPVVLGRLLPTDLPWATRNVLAIPPPRMTRSTFVSRLSRTLILSDTLAPPRIAANGSLGVLEELREHRDLALHQQPGVGRQELGDPDGRGVGAVGRPEGVVDVDVRVRRQLLGELRVVLLLLGVEAQVLEEEELARPESLDRILGADAQRVAGHRDVAPEQLGQTLRRRAAGGGRPGPCRRAGRGGSRGRRARPAPRRWTDRRQGGPDARVVGDLAVLERDVEVDADEDTLAGRVEVANGELVHGAGPIRPGRRRAGGPRRSRSGRRRGSCSPTRCRTRR